MAGKARTNYREFQEAVRAYYAAHGRDLPWRRDLSPYRVVVSEIMLQQTQVDRVRGYFGSWVAKFPAFSDLAAASTQQVLAAWQGLGYNRRALWLSGLAKTIMSDYAGHLPRDPKLLRQLPGIGANTAGSVAAFAYNMPTVFIETNIRRAYLHEFFLGQQSVPDHQLMPLIEATLDRDKPREWYWALMDYGAYLARQATNPNRRSAHYRRQSAFAGSTREIRGRVLNLLLDGPSSVDGMGIADKRLDEVLAALCREGFARRDGELYRIAS